VVDPQAFHWTAQAGRGIPLSELILYELHIGTFTSAGTFNALLPYVGYLKNDLGVTAIELMPVAEFPGARNWGDDGVALYAPHSSYGEPEGLQTTAVNTFA
jgi:maltooligosyltrehalose trehalohydrolase